VKGQRIRPGRKLEARKGAKKIAWRVGKERGETWEVGRNCGVKKPKALSA